VSGRTLMIGAALLLLAAAPQAREPLRDPMRPRVTGATGAATAPQRLQLHGVLIRADDSLALVNERVVRAGDQIGAWQILAVHAEGIRIRAGGREQDIPLNSGRRALRLNRSAQESTP